MCRATSLGRVQAADIETEARPEESPMSTDTVRNPAVRPRDVDRSQRDQHPSRTVIGRIVAGSMAAGLVVAVALVVAPFVPARAEVLTGVVLLGFAVGWTLL